MRGHAFLTTLFMLSFGLVPAYSQTVATKDPTATSYLSSAVKALAQGVPITSATLTGTVTRTAGSDVETGAVTLEALGGGNGRIDLTLSNGSRSSVVGDSDGLPQGAWSGPDGTWHATALHNSLAPADWFFPALALAQAANDPSYTVVLAGQTTLDGISVVHVRFWNTFPDVNGGKGKPFWLQRLSAADVYLNVANFLPVELDFNAHPNNDAGQDIPVEIRYGSYQKLSGILMPTHIQKFLNNSPLLDLNVAGVTLNSSLSTADFTVTTN